MQLFTGKFFTESYMVQFEQKINEYDSVVTHLGKVQDELERFTRLSKNDIINLEKAEKDLIEYSTNLKKEILKICSEFNKAIEEHHLYMKNGSDHLDSLISNSKAEFESYKTSLFNNYEEKTSMSLYESLNKTLQNIIGLENRRLKNRMSNKEIKAASKNAQKLCKLFAARR